MEWVPRQLNGHPATRVKLKSIVLAKKARNRIKSSAPCHFCELQIHSACWGSLLFLLGELWRWWLWPLSSWRWGEPSWGHGPPSHGSCRICRLFCFASHGACGASNKTFLKIYQNLLSAVAITEVDLNPKLQNGKQH